MKIIDFFSRLLLVLIANAIFVQTTIAGDYMNYSMPSTQVADMFRYGEVETSLFTGRLNLSIPLYNLDDPDFSLNMNLRYNAEGFKPRKHSGYVGYNWFLEAGGCITREVRNYADETCREDRSSNTNMRGMLHFIRQHPVDKDKVYVFDNSVGSGCINNSTWNVGNNCSEDVDYLPDIFHFNFCGYQGSFMINNDGEPVIISGDFLKIDLSDFSEENDPNILSTYLEPFRYTTITLTSKNGYKYIFGGDISSVGYSISLTNGNQWADQSHPIINVWYLKKVIAPNKRQITFHYKSPVDPDGLTLTDPLLEMNKYHDLFAQDDFYQNTNQYPSTNTEIKRNMVKTCILDSVVISGIQPLRIHFFNKMDTYSLYFHSIVTGRGDRPYMLDSIHITSGNRILRCIYLVCEHQSSPNHAHYWRFLNNVSISGLGTYSLHYNHAVGTYPDFDVSSVYSFYNTEDYYGYGKGAPSGGLLSQIDYPTGGKQTFTYESHQYSKKRQFVVGGLHNVTMETVNTSVQTLSGVRISKIQTYTSTTDLEETKLFSYQPDLFSSFTGSSGIFYDYRLIYFPTNSNEGFLVTDANSYSMLDTHIGYSYVEETTKDAANNTLSKVGYTFDIGKDTYPSDINIHPDYSGNSYDMINRYAIFSGMLTYSNKLANTGHLLAKDYFREDNKIHSELYCYNNIPLSSTHFIPVGRGHLGNTDTVVIFSHRAIPITRKLYVSPDVMEQHVTQEYDEDGIPMHSNRCYLYDNKLRVRTEYLKYSQNEWRFTRYYYPDDYSLVPISPITRQSLYPTSSLRALVGQHRINVPLEIISGYEIPNGDEYITAGKLNLYKTQTVIIGFDSIFTYTYLNKIMDLNVVKPITDYQYLYFHMDSPNYDSRYKLTCSYEFDSSLRPISISPAGKMPTTYTWNGIYPSTKTIGNQVSTYTFIPHVGISSYTNERGITTYYDYDKNGKLVEVYQINDDRKEIINSYQYHIKTE